MAARSSVWIPARMLSLSRRRAQGLSRKGSMLRGRNYLQERLFLFLDSLYIDPKSETPESIWDRIENAMNGIPAMEDSIKVFLTDRQ